MFKPNFTLKALAALAVGAFLISCNKDKPIVPTPEPEPEPEPEKVFSFETDSLALIAIYNASDGAHWRDGRVWDLTQPVDKWYGIKVDTNETTGVRRVVELNFGVKTIPVDAAEWDLPEELGNLRELTVLKLGTNRCKGSLPAGVYKMKNLTNLTFSTNNLTGGLSEEFGNLTELTNVTFLDNANFGGTIPTSIGNLKKITMINFNNTGMTGSVPATLAGCTSLQYFMAYNCKLSGQLPDIWDQFHNNFASLMLYGNADLTGPLPASIGNIETTATTLSIQLYNCGFTGNIPESWANLPASAKQVFLNGNKLSGEIPLGVYQNQNFSKWINTQGDRIHPQQNGYGLTDPVVPEPEGE